MVQSITKALFKFAMSKFAIFVCKPHVHLPTPTASKRRPAQDLEVSTSGSRTVLGLQASPWSVVTTMFYVRGRIIWR